MPLEETAFQNTTPPEAKQARVLEDPITQMYLSK
jgi:hypothetical protein